MGELHDAIDDPQLRELMRLTESEFTGYSTTGGASATVDGALNVLRVEPGISDRAGEVGAALAGALNDALDRAEAAVKAHVLSDPTLAPDLRGVLDGDALPSDGAVSGAASAADFQGTAAGGLVVVHVTGATRRVSAVYLDRMQPELLDAVPEAANRALAAAELGRGGVMPLAEGIDGVLERLDEKMEAIEERLDGVDDTLDTILRSLD